MRTGAVHFYTVTCMQSLHSGTRRVRKDSPEQAFIRTLTGIRIARLDAGNPPYERRIRATTAKRARAAQDLARFDCRHDEDQPRAVRGARTRRRVAMAERHFPPLLRPCIRECDRPG